MNAFRETLKHEEEKEEEGLYVYGWVKDLHIAFRQKKGAPRELSLPIEIGEKANGSDIIIAH